MFVMILIFIICYIFFTIFYNKIHIDFKSFFRKGFKKLDNTFRIVLLCAVNNGKRKNIFRRKATYGV